MSFEMRSPFKMTRDAVARWLDHGCEGASPENALIMRRARGFGLVAYLIQFFVGAVLAMALGRLQLALIAGLSMILTAGCLRWLGRDSGRQAKLAFHAALGFSLAAICSSSLLADGAPPMSALYPIPLIMAANFVLGVWAAAVWTLTTIGALAYVTFSATPPPDAFDAQSWHAAIFSSRALVIAVVFALGAVARRYENRQNDQLAFLAHHDSLTGLVNRSEFDYRLTLAIARARRHEWSLAMLFIDLDGFKGINDTLGHVAGDSVLRSVGEQIQAATRKTDVASRIGGDEFVVLLEAADEEKSALYGKRLLERIEGCAVHTNPTLRISASVGVAHFPRDAADGQELLRRADVAMYEAKRAGGSRVVVATPPEAP